MPRKHREIRQGLESKGFQVDPGRKHIHFIYVDLGGRTTTARTMLSHAAGGDDVDDSLIGKMAKQIGLSRKEFLMLVDCPMTQHEFDKRIRPTEEIG